MKIRIFDIFLLLRRMKGDHLPSNRRALSPPAQQRLFDKNESRYFRIGEVFDPKLKFDFPSDLI